MRDAAQGFAGGVLVTPQSEPRLFILTDEQASALVELGAALEPFVVSGSPADTATAAMDEQLAQQSRSYSAIVSAARDELEDQLFDVPGADALDLKNVADALVRTVLGVYSLAS